MCSCVMSVCACVRSFKRNGQDAEECRDRPEHCMYCIERADVELFDPHLTSLVLIDRIGSL